MRIYFLDVGLEGLVAEVLFNGFPVMASPAGAKRGTVQVHLRCHRQLAATESFRALATGFGR